MSGEHAWVCSTLYMPYVPMTLAQFGTDEGVAMAGLADKHWAGERFDETALIPVAWWDLNTEGRPRKLRSAFTLHGFTCVTGPVRDVFLAHDIGQTTFVQVQLYGPDRATLVTDQLYLINLGDRKEALDVAQSKRLEKAAIHPADPRVMLKPFNERADDEVVLTRAALTGPEVWSDPLLHTAFFVSDRLYGALRKARLHASFGFTRCVIQD